MMARFINPKTRKLIKITSTEASEMNKYFDLFMGNDVGPRKNYIETHFDDFNMEELDIS